jgi:hypothetical protein
MKKFVLASVLGALSLAALAQTTPGGDTVTIQARGPKISVPDKIRSMPLDEFNRFTGSYELANGNSLALFSRGLKKYAKVHGEAWHEIVATSANSFVALDKQLEMTIDRQENGEVKGELLMVVPDQLANGTTSEHVVEFAFR